VRRAVDVHGRLVIRVEEIRGGPARLDEVLGVGREAQAAAIEVREPASFQAGPRKPAQGHQVVSTASLGGWIGEYDVINARAKNPEERYRLYTLISEEPKRLVCNPDAAFLLPVGEHRRIFYLEL